MWLYLAQARAGEAGARDALAAYGEALATAGVKTRCTVYPGMTHGFNGRVGMVDAAKDALDEAAAGIRQSFGI